MSYTKTNWQNLPSTSTPIVANSLNNMETGIADANGAIAVNTYSSSSTYAVGDYCIYNNKLYKCKTAITTAEAFNSTKWVQIKIAEEINNTGATVSPTEPTGNNKNKVWFKKGKNLFSGVFESVTKNGITSSFKDGVLTLNGTATAQIELNYFCPSIIMQAKTAYTMSAFYVSGTVNGTATLYAQNSTNWKGLNVTVDNSNNSFTRDDTYSNEDIILNASKFLRIENGTSFTNYKVKFQIEEGEQRTSYVPYEEPKIYIKNDNNIYGEFDTNRIFTRKTYTTTIEDNANVAPFSSYGSINITADEVSQYGEIVSVYSINNAGAPMPCGYIKQAGGNYSIRLVSNTTHKNMTVRVVFSKEKMIAIT